MIFTTHLLHAQNPPIALEWSAFLPYGNAQGIYNRICLDGAQTAWMLRDDGAYEISTTDGVVRRYNANGLPMDGTYAYTNFDCGSLDAPIDFYFRNDSTWGLMTWQYIGGNQPILYCLTTPGGGYSPQPILDDGLYQQATDLLVQGTDCTISASYDSTFTAEHQRLTKVDVGGVVIWDRLYPTAQFNGFAALENAPNGDIIVADMPEVHVFSATNGDLLNSFSAYTGAPTLKGDIKVWNNEIYWAATEGTMVYYGRTLLDGTPVWSDTIASSDATRIAVDDQGRMWLIGTLSGQGVLSVIEADGSLNGTWYYGASLTDIQFGNSRIHITGAMDATDPTTFLISGTPDF